MSLKSGPAATMEDLAEAGRAYAVAVVVRTIAATSAKAGSKAVFDEEGTLLSGWIGGGCATGAASKAARLAIAENRPTLLSIRPEDLIADGVELGKETDGVTYARSMCPSRGSLDIFIEPVRPGPQLEVIGESPVAEALRHIGDQFGFSPAPPGTAGAYCVVASQGRKDIDALNRALAVPRPYTAFVGSRAKWDSLRTKLTALGADPSRLAEVQAPAGLDIGAVTPDEIALSIMAQAVLVRRRGARAPAAHATSLEV
ncbi:MAG: XdhC family protein [Pseudomonadota bacterium]